MEQPNRSRERDVTAAQHRHLAAHTAQRRQILARRETPAIDDDAAVTGRAPHRRGHRGAELERPAEPPDLAHQEGENAPRFHVAFVGIEEAATEAIGKVRLEVCDGLGSPPRGGRRSCGQSA